MESLRHTCTQQLTVPETHPGHAKTDTLFPLNHLYIYNNNNSIYVHIYIYIYIYITTLQQPQAEQ